MDRKRERGFANLLGMEMWLEKSLLWEWLNYSSVWRYGCLCQGAFRIRQDDKGNKGLGVYVVQGTIAFVFCFLCGRELRMECLRA